MFDNFRASARRSSLPTTRQRGCHRALTAGVAASLASALFTPVVATPAEAATTTPFASRMISRWTSYTDAAGTVWAPRSNTLGTLRSSTALEGKDIAGTTKDALYQYVALGVTGYNVSVPRPATYKVTMHLAEGWWAEAGKRVFDVDAEGVPAATGIDIAKAVGKGAAYDVSFTVPVTDGRLDLAFKAKADLPVLSSIEVDEVPATTATPTPTVTTTTTPTPTTTTPAPTSTTTSPTPTATSTTTTPAPAPTTTTATPTPTSTTTTATPDSSTGAQLVTTPAPTTAPTQTFAFRMTTAPTNLTDSKGNVWRRRGPALGSAKYNTALIGKDVANTVDDALYQRSVVGSKGMLVPVPAAAANYHVRLLFAEAYWTQPGQRVIDVQAEDRTVATNVDPVAAVGPKAAYDVEFDTRVEDGMLTLEFVNKVDQPMVAGIEVTSTDPAAAGELPMASLIPQPPTSEFRQDLTTAPVADNSAAAMTRLRGAIDAGKGWNAGVNAYQYNSAFYRVNASTPRHTVGFYDCQGKGWTPHGLYDGPQYFVDVPIPDGAVPATGTDSQMGIYDPTTDKLWEFWVMRQTATGGWEACWGGRIDGVSTSTGQFPAPFGVSASGMIMAGGMVSIQEAARGEINHALYLTVTEAQKLLYSYPANRTDGRSDGPDLLLEGQRLRLDPSIDVTTLGLTPFGEVVARAAQKYGFIVSDLGGNVAIGTESGRQDERRTGMNPWNVLLGGASYDALAKFPWDKVAVMPVDHGDPTK